MTYQQVTYHQSALDALDSHLRFANHKQVSLTCPVCIAIVKDGTLVRGNDGFYRSIEQNKAQRMSDGRQPGDFV